MPYVTSKGADIVTGQVTIASGASLSDAAFLGGLALHGIVMPAAWTVAGLTFQVSFDQGATWVEMTTSAGSAVSLTVAASQFIAVDPVLWRAVAAIKVRSGTSGAPVNQAADRVLTLVCRPIV
jgi:hypothetical protein